MSTFVPTSLKDIQLAEAKKADKVIDLVTEKAPILRNFIPFEPSTHFVWDVYEEITDVTGPSVTGFDAAPPQVGSSSELKQIYLTPIKGKIECGRDKAKGYGGPDKYFSRRMPVIMRKAGQDLEYSMLYDSIRQYCLDNSRYTRVDTTNGGSVYYSMLFVRYEEGSCCGLYSPEHFPINAGIDMTPIHGGSAYPSLGDTEYDAGAMVYGMELNGYFGFKIADKRCVYALVNIDSTSLPTEEQINNALVQIRAEPTIEGMAGKAFIFCHPVVKMYLQGVFKASDYMRVMTKDMALGQTFNTWNGVPFPLSYNFLEGTEAFVAS